jgi:hypothetical protein
MGLIGLNIDFEGILEEFDRAKDEFISKEMIPELAKVGERFVNHAKSLKQPPTSMRGTPHQPNYIDDTTALRNANSYEIYRKGKPVIGNVGKPETDKLFENTKDAAIEVELLLGNGIKYAEYVEKNGYDVVSSAQAKAEQEIRAKFN